MVPAGLFHYSEWLASLCLGNGAFNPKYMRDVLVIPIFIMLGMTYRFGSLTRPVVIIQTVTFAVAILEAVSPEAYSEIFQVLKYYVNTRDFSTDLFLERRFQPVRQRDAARRQIFWLC